MFQLHDSDVVSNGTGIYVSAAPSLSPMAWKYTYFFDGTILSSSQKHGNTFFDRHDSSVVANGKRSVPAEVSNGNILPSGTIPPSPPMIWEDSFRMHKYIDIF